MRSTSQKVSDFRTYFKNLKEGLEQNGNGNSGNPTGIITLQAEPNMCITVGQRKSDYSIELHMAECTSNNPNQIFESLSESNQIRHVDTGYCIDDYGVYVGE